MKEKTLKKLQLFSPYSSLVLPQVVKNWLFHQAKLDILEGRGSPVEGNCGADRLVWGTLPECLKGRRKIKHTHTHNALKLITTARDTRGWDPGLGCTRKTRNFLAANLLSQRRWILCACLSPIYEPQAPLLPAQLPAERSASATLRFAMEYMNFGMQCMCRASHSGTLTSYRPAQHNFKAH